MPLRVAAEPPRRHRLAHVPQKDGAIAASRHEALVVGRDGEAGDFVAVRGVRLDEAPLWHGRLCAGPDLGDGRAGEGIVQPDGAICRPGEDVVAGRSRISYGVNRT